MLRSRFCHFILAGLLVAGSRTPLHAQVGGSISGTIKDASGGVVPGVSVTAIDVRRATSFSAVTNNQGLYSFPKLPVGSYDLTVQIDGFKPQRRTGLVVDADSAV